MEQKLKLRLSLAKNNQIFLGFDTIKINLVVNISRATTFEWPPMTYSEGNTKRGGWETMVCCNIVTESTSPASTVRQGNEKNKKENKH